MAMATDFIKHYLRWLHICASDGETGNRMKWDSETPMILQTHEEIPRPNVSRNWPKNIMSILLLTAMVCFDGFFVVFICQKYPKYTQHPCIPEGNSYSNEAAIMLIDIGIIAKNLSPVNKTFLNKRRYDSYMPRLAVNFLINTSSTQESGIQWRKPREFERNNFILLGGGYNDGKVLIPKTALYTIYNFFTVMSTQSNMEEGNVIITHKIIRGKGQNGRNGKGKEITMLRKDTVLGPGVHETSNLLGIFYLEKGDIVYPWLSNVSAIYKMSVMSWWGLFAL